MTPANGDQMARSVPERLAELAVALGEPASEDKALFRLADRGSAWFVDRGAVDVFVVEYRDGTIVSGFKHLLRADSGRLVFGVGEAGNRETLAVVAKVLPGTAVRRVPVHALVQHGAGDEVADQVDAWVTAFSAAIVRDVELCPNPDKLLANGAEVEAGSGCVLAAEKGLVWATAVRAETVEFIGADHTLSVNAAIPLTLESWIRLDAPAKVTGRSSQDLQAGKQLLSALDEFHRLALDVERFNRRLSLVDEANLQVSRARRRRDDAARARSELFGVLARSVPRADTAEALDAALKMIGTYEGIDFPVSGDNGAAYTVASSLQDILQSSGVRWRQVRLADDDRWWRGDSGALLTFRSADGQPVALLPGTWGGYRVVDPGTGRSTRVTRKRASALGPEAWCFYRPLCPGQPAGAADVLRFAGRHVLADGLRLLSAGMAAGLALLTPAVAVGVLADVAIPAAAEGVLVQITAALVVLAAAASLLQIRGGLALMRIEGRVAARLGAATWDRLLGMTRRFFERFTPGELLVRVAVFHALREQIAGTVAAAVQCVMYLLPAFALIFLYDARLGLWSFGLGLLSLGTLAVLGLRQIGPHRQFNRMSRQILSDLFQFINGIGKLRALGAEDSAFARWARSYREQQHARMRIGRLSDHLVAFSTAVPAIGTAALFGAVLWSGTTSIMVGDFLAAYASAMIFYSAIVGLGQSAEAVAGIFPVAEQAGPILDAVPQTPPARGAQVELRGGIRFDHVSFRYAESDALVLDNVSWHARPGEFIAIVGESGSGKSTLLRLALGLEEPEVGAVCLDGRNFKHLDRRAVRRQFGVVVQDGILHHSTVLENIIGVSNELTIDDAWQAARLADVDHDIRAMPMGMYTAVGGGASVSGGQAQRIRIASALVNNPRILLFDEATSWLDARSQARVMESIQSLAVTRIVIAHRLSTIRQANRIYVLSAGRIMQQGSFDELFAQEGVFREMMRRQMTSSGSA